MVYVLDFMAPFTAVPHSVPPAGLAITVRFVLVPAKAAHPVRQAALK